MLYSINFDKKEYVEEFDCSKADILPDGWSEQDLMKVLSTPDYKIPKDFKKIL